MTGLVVEITEHEIADDLETLRSAARRRCAPAAPRIAVDDAGAGYSASST
jgi:EAL domain-containing protein (putative c-di-GMP-specific phosphodiesterase class I)